VCNRRSDDYLFDEWSHGVGAEVSIMDSENYREALHELFNENFSVDEAIKELLLMVWDGI
jgi:hypothetical protein